MSERYADVAREALRWAAREAAWERVLETVRAQAPPPEQPELMPRPIVAMPIRRKPRRWRLLFRGAILATILAVLGTNAFVLTNRGVTTEVGLDQAIAGFRESIPARVQARAARALAAPASARATTPHRRPAAGFGAPTPTAPPVALPADGVYTYRTTGGERISFGGGHHDYPERTYASVKAQRGCVWRLEHTIIAEHTEERSFCTRSAMVALVTETVAITFFGHTDGGTYRCEPPLPFGDGARRAGSSLRVTCANGEERVDSTVRFLAPEAITVGDTVVRALRVTIDGVVSGRATGTSHSDVWVHPVTGMLLKLSRVVHSESEAFGTTVSYDEEATFVLASLRPRV